MQEARCFRIFEVRMVCRLKKVYILRNSKKNFYEKDISSLGFVFGSDNFN